jgi:squalene-hopene/tetraprenyl-beta-curcumene cyclase
MHVPSESSISEKIIRTQILQFEAGQILSDIFPKDSTFWNAYRQMFAAYYNAILTEHSFVASTRKLSEYSSFLAESIAIGKSAVSRLAVFSLGAVTGQWNTVERLDRSLCQYLVARQYFDDLRDWKEDLERRLPSIVLASLLRQWPENEAAAESANARDLVARLHYEGHSRQVLDLALAALDRAAMDAGDAPHWRNEIARFRSVTDSMRNDIATLVNTNIKRSQRIKSLELPALNIRSESTTRPINRALEFLMTQFRLGFGEARHVMKFDLSRTGVDNFESGDVFARAIIADCLLDATGLDPAALQPIVNDELDYLISVRRKTRVGGWAYFPDFRAVPADADDLAQVMIGLLRAGRTADIERYCTVPLSFLLTDCAKPDGSFETWIVPAVQVDDEERYERHCSDKYWGTGPDPEVVANLLYALWLYDRDKYSAVIERGCTYLERVQSDNGAWVSSWYHGPFFTVPMCARAFWLPFVRRVLACKPPPI